MRWFKDTVYYKNIILIFSVIYISTNSPFLSPKLKLLYLLQLDVIGAGKKKNIATWRIYPEHDFD